MKAGRAQPPQYRGRGNQAAKGRGPFLFWGLQGSAREGPLGRDQSSSRQKRIILCLWTQQLSG